MYEGPFGNSVGRDLILVQSIDGKLQFFEDSVASFTRQIADCLLPGNVCLFVLLFLFWYMLFVIYLSLNTHRTSRICPKDRRLHHMQLCLSCWVLQVSGVSWHTHVLLYTTHTWVRVSLIAKCNHLLNTIFVRSLLVLKPK